MTDITATTIRQAGQAVENWQLQNQAFEVHTVTITLNGAHGGLDIIVEAINRDGIVSDERKETLVVR